jgi:hypothetical protein
MNIAVSFEEAPFVPGKKKAGLAGPGQIEVVSDAVWIHGKLPRVWLPRLAGCLAGAAVTAAVAWILVVVGLERWITGKVALAIGLVFWIAPWFAVSDLLQRKMSGTSVSVRLPRSCVRLEQRQESRLVLDLLTGPTVDEIARPRRSTRAPRWRRH